MVTRPWRNLRASGPRTPSNERRAERFTAHRDDGVGGREEEDGEEDEEGDKGGWVAKGRAKCCVWDPLANREETRRSMEISL